MNYSELRYRLTNILYRLGINKILRLGQKNKLTVLSFHRISDEENYFFNPIKPKVFEMLVDYLVKNFSVTSFDRLSETKNFTKPPLILSFDDGYYDFYENALPVLLKYKIPSNHNIVNECANNNSVIWTQRLNNIFDFSRKNNINLKFDFSKSMSAEVFQYNWIDFYLTVFSSMLNFSDSERLELIAEKENTLSINSSERMMNWNEITECANLNVEIGSHSYTHNSMNSILDIETLELEVSQSKKEIEKHIQREVITFAFPNGQSNDLANDYVRKTGFKNILYVNDKVNSLENTKTDQPLLFDRIYLLDEPYSEMLLRIHLFHAKLRKYVRIFN
jgi:peptidoglycan/xylan/chitin deacetylase (PgdA/CDA1 family)